VLPLLPTPTALMTWRTPHEHMAWRRRNGRTRPCDLQAAVVLLPTPRASDADKGSPNQHDSHGRWMLTSAIAHLPTPRTAGNPPS
jgi:hypothetical protein